MTVRTAAVLVLLLWSSGAHAADIGIAPPGVLVDVGGHRVHLFCTGTAAPTVILLGDRASFSIDWTLVQQQLTTRTCAFDRPGYAWSDSAGVIDDSNQVVRDLHEALLRSNQPRPYVLVGHSLGGFFARLYYDAYPQDVGGVVLVDAANEDAPSWPPRVPEIRLDEPYRRLPAQLQQVHLALLSKFVADMNGATTAQMAASQKASDATLTHLREIGALLEHPLRDAPLVVLSSGMNSDALQQRLQADLARLSTNTMHVTVTRADHDIPLSAPGTAATWIDIVVDAVRTGQPLGPGLAQ